MFLSEDSITFLRFKILIILRVIVLFVNFYDAMNWKIMLVVVNTINLQYTKVYKVPWDWCTYILYTNQSIISPTKQPTKRPLEWDATRICNCIRQSPAKLDKQTILEFN